MGFGNTYDVIIVGSGLVGLCCTNLLSQYGIRVLNVSHVSDMESRPDIATLNFQGWLISGTTWYMDPVPSILSKYYSEFNRVTGLIEQFENPRRAANGIAIINNKQYEKIKQQKLKHNLAPFSRIESESRIYDLIKQNPDPDLVYLDVLDKPYSSGILLNALYRTCTLNGVTFHRTHNKVNLKPSNNKNGYSIEIDGKKIKTTYLFNCAGAKAVELISPLIKKHSSTPIFEDPSLTQFKLKRQFSTIVHRNPIVSFRNNTDIAASLIVDLTQRFSMAKQGVNGNLVFASSKHSFEPQAMDMSQLRLNESRCKQDLILQVKRIYPRLSELENWFCSRMERIVQPVKHNVNRPTVSNWAGKLPGFDSIIMNITGKGTLAFNTALEMISLTEYEINNELDYKLDFDFKEIIYTANIDK